MPDAHQHGGGGFRFHRVSKSFDREGPGGEQVHPARDLDLRIDPGESVGIIGPNGAGKSTLLRMVTGVSAPTRGTIERTGRTSSVIELGLGIHPDLTGDENLDLLALLYGIDGATLGRRRPEIVEFSGLGEALHHVCRTYSTGMLARLAFSVACHSDPDLLLLDEVLSVGDASFRQRASHRIAQLRESGTTVVLVSHDLPLVSEICERVILLVDGSIEADGEADAIIRRYVGLPAAPASGAQLEVSLERSLVPSGSELLLEVAQHFGSVASQLRIDLVVRDHPTFLETGERISVVFGSAVHAVPATETFSVAIPTALLPAGRFEVHCGLVDADGRQLATAAAPLTLTGPEGAFAIRLDGTCAIDAVDRREARR